MTKFIVVGTSASGKQACVDVGEDASDAQAAFSGAVESGKYDRVEMIRYPPISKRWSAPPPKPAKKGKRG